MQEEKMVSCIMPIYNCGQYLQDAIDSILQQSYTKFELIIIDDCSTDNSIQIIQSYSDSRIILLRNGQNRGIVYSLNKGIAVAKGTYIARMDGDDICMPNRFEQQVSFLEKNNDISLVSCWFEMFGDASGPIQYETDPEMIKCKILFSLQLLHPGWMFVKKAFIDYNLRYEEQYKYAEDYALLSKACQHIKMSNVSEVLMKYRVSGNQTSAQKNDLQTRLRTQIIKQQLERINCILSEEELMQYVNISNKNVLCTKKTLILLDHIYWKILKANEKTGFYNQFVLKKVFADSYYNLCYYNALHGNGSGFVFFKSKFRNYVCLKQIIKLCLRSMRCLRK